MTDSDIRIILQGLGITVVIGLLHAVFGFLYMFPSDLLFFFIGILILYAVFQLSITPLWLKPLCAVLFFSYIIFSSGLSSLIRPFFNDMSEWHVTENNQTYSFRGTGVPISSHHLLTNFHVTGGCKKLKIRYPDNTTSDATVVQSLEKHFSLIAGNTEGYDISLLHTPKKQKAYAVINDNVALEGDKIIGPDYTNTPGKFRKRYGTVKASSDERLEFSGQGRKGNSGSPIYNKQGYLIAVQWGVNSFSLDRTSNTGTPISIIRPWLQKQRIPLARSRNYDKDVSDTDFFNQAFAVGILCYQ